MKDPENERLEEVIDDDTLQSNGLLQSIKRIRKKLEKLKKIEKRGN